MSASLAENMKIYAGSGWIKRYISSGNELMLCQLEAQVLEPTSVTLFCLNS